MENIKPKRGRPKTPPMNKTIKSDFMDVNEVAQYLKMSTSHIYSMTSTKKIPHIKMLGKKILFEKGEIIDWLKSKKVSAK